MLTFLDLIKLFVHLLNANTTDARVREVLAVLSISRRTLVLSGLLRIWLRCGGSSGVPVIVVGKGTSGSFATIGLCCTSRGSWSVAFCRNSVFPP